MCKVAMCRPTSRWRRVSVKDIDVYIPWNMPVEAPGRTFEFRLVETAGEAIAVKTGSLPILSFRGSGGQGMA